MKNKIASFLKNVIDSNGKDFPWKSPMKVLEMAHNSNLLNDQEAKILCYILLWGEQFWKELEMSVSESSTESPKNISKLIQDKCKLNATVSKKFGEVFSELFANENQKKWQTMDEAGFKEFCSMKWDMDWQGEYTWYVDNVHIDCDGCAEICFKVKNKTKFRDLVQPLLNENSFVSSEDIFEYVSKKISSLLDDGFEQYCSSDDYYPPVAEDFDGEYYIEDFVKKFGLDIVSITYEGCTGDYEPNF
ncbi:MAG: hypothetical protein KBS95_01935 [Alistipes sp.]|nr:hypothetical protein [Candidatus Alistipes equi]